MRLRHIEVFYAVYTTGSVSGAARVLNVSQPAVSKVLRHAEDQLGFKLFERSRSGLVPTQDALALIPEAEKVFQHVDAFKRTARNLKDNKSGHIRIAVITGLGLELTPRAIARFQPRYPDATFDVRTEHYDRLLSALLEFEIDVGLAFQPPDYPGVARVRLGEAELVCVHPSDVLLDARSPMPIARLAEHSLVAMTEQGPLGRALSSALNRAGLQIEPRTIAETCFVAKSLVNQGMGVTVVDEFTARAPGHDRLRFTKLDPPITVSLEGIFLETRPLSTLCREFLYSFRDALADYNRG